MYPDRQVQLVHVVFQDLLVAMVSTAFPVILALEVALVHLVVLVVLVCPDPKVLLVIRETKETLDLQVHQ